MAWFKNLEKALRFIWALPLGIAKLKSLSDSKGGGYLVSLKGHPFENPNDGEQAKDSVDA